MKKIIFIIMSLCSLLVAINTAIKFSINLTKLQEGALNIPEGAIASFIPISIIGIVLMLGISILFAYVAQKDL
jgi:TRAP-type C4-dicarboxylate transport system permease small subunit